MPVMGVGRDEPCKGEGVPGEDGDVVVMVVVVVVVVAIMKVVQNVGV